MSGPGGTAFVFPGIGTDWHAMGAGLLGTSPVFTETAEDCARTFADSLDYSVLDVLRGADDAADLDRVDVSMPVAFTMLVSLSALWQESGVVPSAVVGHSVGEVAAAHLAGALTLEDAALVCALRARAWQTVNGQAAIIAVALPHDALVERLRPWGDALAIVAVNSPGSCTVCGPLAAGEQLIESCRADGVRATRVPGPAAYVHVPQLDPLRDQVLAGLAGVRPGSSTIPFYSTVTGSRMDTTLLDNTYWWRNMREPVRFGKALETLVRDGYRTFVEPSAHPTVSPYVREVVEHADVSARVVSTLRRGEGGLGQFRQAVHRLQTHKDSAVRRTAPSEASLLEAVSAGVSELVGIKEAVDPQRPFRDLGFDSALLVELREHLQRVTGQAFSVDAMFSHPTPAALARSLAGGLDGGGARAEAALTRDEPIAIVSMSCRFPGGVRSADDLWRLVDSGTDAVSAFPVDRGWVLGDPPLPGLGGFLDAAGEFDADFFGISPREALAMDPQQRLLLEEAWKTFERAGLDPAALREQSTGVFVGSFPQEYGPRQYDAPKDLQGYLFTGGTGSIASGRIAYVFDLAGPALTVDTACSSSLVAIHLAGQALRSGECDLALAGGVTVMASPLLLVDMARQRGLAPDGRCKPFAAAADGVGWSEGVGLLLLERLSDARRNGHPVVAVIRGSAINSDGTSNGLTAPNGRAQERLIRQALANARLTPDQVDAAEAHGTGTLRGDPVEAAALLSTYGQHRDRPFLLSCLKSNIGHTQAASGVAGVIGMVQAMRQGRLPKVLHVDRPSPEIGWDSASAQLVTENTPWPATGAPRRAAVSSFGFSGTNAHLILEEATPSVPETAVCSTGAATPVVLSAKSEPALREQATRLHARLTADPGLSVLDTGYSLATGRARLPHRAAFVTADRTELLSGLKDLSEGEPGPITGHVSGPRKTVFVLSGQGAYWPGMAAELLDTAPAFADCVHAVADALAPHLDWSLLDVLRGAHGAASMDRPDVSQPALFAMQVALAALWRAHGVVPDAVVGHSQGEVAAAYLAGALSLSDAGLLIARRGALCASPAAAGAMVSVAAAADAIAPMLRRWEGLTIAAVNSPQSCTVSGEPTACAEFIAACEACGMEAKPIRGASFASHSPRMAALRERALKDFASISARAAAIPIYSTVTGTQLTGTELGSEYWYRNMREPVRFQDAVRRLVDDRYQVFVESSPHPVLAGYCRETALDAGADIAAMGTLRRQHGGLEQFRTSLATAHVHGCDPDWSAVFAGTGARRVELPTYPFQRRHYWLSPAADEGRLRAGTDTKPSRYRVAWRPVSQPAGKAPTGTWLLVHLAGQEDDPRLLACVRALQESGAEPRLVVMAGDDDRQAVCERLRTATSRDRAPSGVLSFLGAVTTPHRDHAVPAGLAATLTVVQAMTDADFGVPLWLVTAGAVSVDTDDAPSEEAQAQVWAWGRCLALEHPLLWGGMVDLPAAAGAWAGDGLRQALRAGVEDQLAVREGGLFAPRLVPAPSPGTVAQDWQPTGTALVTGGTGALGSHVARWLARAGSRHIVLVSRRGPKAPGADRLAAQIRELGAACTVIAADVADRASLAEAIRRVEADSDAIRTVVHAAGTHHHSPISACSITELAEMNTTAVSAALLDELLGDRLDTFVLFSSAAAVWGGGGQSAYAAANAYLDALAAGRRAKGLPATVLDWGVWDGPGMGSTDGTAQRLVSRGMRPLQPAAAIGVLAQALSHDESALVVADVDWPQFTRTFTAARPRPLLAELPGSAAAAESQEPSASEPGLPLAILNLPQSDRRTALASLVRRQVAAVLKHQAPEAIDSDRAFKELGFDSLAAVELAERLSTATGRPLRPTVVFDHPTIDRLTEHVLEHVPSTGRQTAQTTTAPAVTATEPIAIIGTACRFPGGVHTPEQLWDLLAQGTDAVTPFPADRGWDPGIYHPDPDHAGTSYSAHGGFCEDIDEFDAEFFHISPREALVMDPQQRMLLETAWEAVERAGIDPLALRDSRTGVFAGLSTFAGAWPQHPASASAKDALEGYVLTGTAGSVLAGRVSYALGLRGPAITTDTACSSSLVSLHLACRALRDGECSLALAGGVTVMSTPATFVMFSRQHGLARDGRCKPFAAAADGVGWAEGVGMLLLEPLSLARRNGHRVLGLVRGSAINHDGASNGLTAPSGDAQREVIQLALSHAGLTTSDIDAVEAHGTGTSLGDPIEAEALLATYGQDRPADRPLLIGSMKSNIGHTQAASGVGGVIKMLQAMQHGVLPKTLHVDRPTPKVDWTAGGVRLLEHPQPWPQTGRPRRAGVSAFGISGTNAHVIIEGPADPADVQAPRPEVDGPVPVVLSARNERALRAHARQLHDFLVTHPDIHAADLAYSLATTRSAFSHRAIVLADSRGTLLRNLLAAAEGTDAAELFTGRAAAGDRPTIVPVQGDDLHALSQAYAKGEPVDFSALLSALGGRRIDLPTYPFQRRRFPLTPPAASSATAHHDASPHPFLHSFTELPDGGRLFTGEVRVAAQPWLADHVIGDEILFPGTAFVELALHASARLGCAGLGKLTIEARLPLPAHGAVELQMVAGAPDTAGDRRLVIRARTDGGAWRRHAVGVLSAHLASGGADVQTQQPADAEPMDVARLYENLAAHGYHFGPAFRHLHAAWRHGDEIYVEAQLPERLMEKRFALHPALLDATLHALEPQAEALPFSWAGLAQHAAAGTVLRARMSRNGENRVSITITDPAGGTLATVGSVTFRRKTPRPGPLLRLDWVPAGTPGAEADPLPPDVLVVPRSTAAGTDPLDATHSLVHDTVTLIQDWFADPRNRYERLAILTSGAIATGPDEQVNDLAAAAVWGLVRAVQWEYPERIVLIDHDDADASHRALGAALAFGRREIAIRSGELRLPQLVSTACQTRSRPLNPHGTVLITGGTGALGGLTAHLLVTRHGARHLLLASRRGPHAEGAATLASELRALGATVTIAACDVSDPDDLRQMLAAVPAEHPLTAVVHAAGVVDDATLRTLTPERIDVVVRAKAASAWHLHRLTADLDLCAFVLFSSVVGITGNAGQSAYTAANAFLDALAQMRHAHGKPALSVAWGWWAQHSGATGRLDRRLGARLIRCGINPMETEKGLDLLDTALGAMDQPTLIAGDFDLAKLRKAHREARPTRAIHPPAKDHSTALEDHHDN